MSSGWQVSIGTNAPTELGRDFVHGLKMSQRATFSGVATSYTKDIQVPSGDDSEGLVTVSWILAMEFRLRPQTLRNGMQAWLEGPIREAAVVYINDKRAGAQSGAPPYSTRCRRRF